MFDMFAVCTKASLQAIAYTSRQWYILYIPVNSCILPRPPAVFSHDQPDFKVVYFSSMAGGRRNLGERGAPVTKARADRPNAGGRDNFSSFWRIFGTHALFILDRVCLTETEKFFLYQNIEKKIFCYKKVLFSLLIILNIKNHKSLQKKK